MNLNLFFVNIGHKLYAMKYVQKRVSIKTVQNLQVFMEKEFFNGKKVLTLQ